MNPSLRVAPSEFTNIVGPPLLHSSVQVTRTQNIEREQSVVVGCTPDVVHQVTQGTIDLRVALLWISVFLVYRYDQISEFYRNEPSARLDHEERSLYEWFGEAGVSGEQANRSGLARDDRDEDDAYGLQRGCSIVADDIRQVFSIKRMEKGRSHSVQHLLSSREFRLSNLTRVNTQVQGRPAFIRE